MSFYSLLGSLFWTTIQFIWNYQARQAETSWTLISDTCMRICTAVVAASGWVRRILRTAETSLALKSLTVAQRTLLYSVMPRVGCCLFWARYSLSAKTIVRTLLCWRVVDCTESCVLVGATTLALKKRWPLAALQRPLLLLLLHPLQWQCHGGTKGQSYYFLVSLFLTCSCSVFVTIYNQLIPAVFLSKACCSQIFFRVLSRVRIERARNSDVVHDQRRMEWSELNLQQFSRGRRFFVFMESKGYTFLFHTERLTHSRGRLLLSPW